MSEDLAGLAASTGKMLRWAGFLVAVSLVILLIDLQLKRAIGRQAVVAAEKFAAANRMADTIATRAMGAGFAAKGAARGPDATAGAGRDTDHSSADRGPDVVADTGVAAGTDHAGNPAEVLPAAAPAGPRKRPPGNGRRARGPESGS